MVATKRGLSPFGCSLRRRVSGSVVGLVELFLIAVGLSMDAFAVSVGKGMGMRKLDMGQALVIALFFGGFQALMPVIGWALGEQFAHYVTAVAHWIAFALLAFIGGKMIWEAVRGEAEQEGGPSSRLSIRELLLLAVATSIDALAVGVTFAFLEVNIVFSAALIGVTTFAISFGGVAIGHQFGSRWERPSTIAGGVILVLIGAKIVLDHFIG